MSIMPISRMFLSETEGWADVLRLHPSLSKLLGYFVLPMSLIPPLMYAYASLLTPGAVLPPLQPPLSGNETLVVGAMFWVTEIAMVFWMALVIQNIAEYLNVFSGFERAFTLAAIAPTPLWLSPLALFVPSLGVNLALTALAWVGSAALIWHGVRPLIGVQEGLAAHRMANIVIFAGVMAWVVMIITLTALLSLVVGLR